MSFICPERNYPFPQQLHDGNCLIIAPGIVLKTKLEPLSLSPVQPSHLCLLNLPTFFFFKYWFSPPHSWDIFVYLSPKVKYIGIVETNHPLQSLPKSNHCQLANFTTSSPFFFCGIYWGFLNCNTNCQKKTKKTICNFLWTNMPWYGSCY